MPRRKHLWDAAGLVALPLIVMAFVYFHFLEDYVADRLPASASEQWEIYPSLRIGKNKRLFVLTPTVQLVFGLAAGGVAAAVFYVAHILERQELDEAVREEPSNLLRHGTVDTGERADVADCPAQRPAPQHPDEFPPQAAALRAPPPEPPRVKIARRVEEIFTSLKCRWKQVAADTWRAELGRFRGYPLCFVVQAEGDCLLFQVQAPLVQEQRWDPNVLAGVLLEANARLHYGSFRFVDSRTGQLVVLGQVCDTRYFPPSLLREIAWQLAERYRDMICQLYALDLIEDGWSDGGWSAPS